MNAIGTRDRPATANLVIEDWRPMVRNSLRGFARVRFPSGVVMHEVSLHISNGRAWASPPSRPMVDRVGTVMRDADGKTRWQPMITFADKNVRDSWSALVVDAVHDAHPAALRDAIPESEA